MRHGIAVVENPSKYVSDPKSKPLEGRVYFTSNVLYALSYTFPGCELFTGRGGMELFSSRLRQWRDEVEQIGIVPGENCSNLIGFLFTLDGSVLTQDTLPDEDDIGSIISDIYDRGGQYEISLTDRTALMRATEEAFLDKARDSYAQLRMKSPDLLQTPSDEWLIKRYLGPIEVWNIGKPVLKRLPVETITSLMSTTLSISHEGGVMPMAGYEINLKTLTRDLLPDLSNVTSLGRRIF